MTSDHSSILADMGLLYELSLSIGTSLNLEENSARFLRTLLSRKSLDYAAVWIFDDALPETTGSPGLYLRYALPKIYRRDEWLDRSHAFVTQMETEELLTFSAINELYAYEMRPVDSGSIAIFRLGDVGILELYATRFDDGLPRKDLFQIRDLVRKFAVSLKACLSNERNLWEIAQRAQTEAQLRAQRNFAFQIMEKMGQGLIVSRLDGKTEYVNPAFVILMEGQESDFIRTDLLRFAEPADRKMLRQKFSENLQGHVTEYTLRISTMLGTKRFVQVSSVPRRVDDKITGVISVFTDVTKQKQIEDSLEDARDQALRTSQLKSEFMATMSHELRTPMNGIIGFSELLLETPLNDEQREFASLVLGESRVMLELVNETLDFSKIEAGQMMFSPVRANLRELVEGVGQVLAPRITESNVNLMTYIDPQIPESVFLDGGRLRQVLLNLGENAVKFTHEGEISIQAHLLEHDVANQSVTVRFEVLDTGIGIEPALHEKIFLPFQQGDGSTTRKYGGTGLGLAITKNLVEFFGGELTLESQTDRGSLFWFEIDIDVVPEKKDLSGGRRQDLLRGKNILVVDGSEVHRFILTTYLGNLGANVFAVRDAAEGLATLQSQMAFDLVIIEWMMPAMDGFAMAAEIQKLELASPPVLGLLMPFGSVASESAAMAYGFNGFIKRPVSLQKLASLVSDLLFEESQGLALSDTVDPEDAEPLSESSPLLLLVEDNATSQRVIQYQLSRLGYRVEVAGTGQEGLEAVRKNPRSYDLILMDCHMPEMDGYEATARIRDLDIPQPPILAITANALFEDRDRCLAAGMNDCVVKPIQIEALKSALDRRLADGQA